MTESLNLDVDESTLNRIEELEEKAQQDVSLQLAFAVEDLVQEKHQELRMAERQQEQVVNE